MTSPRLSGLRLDEGIMSFTFSPSVGILARDIDKLGLSISSFREPLEKSVTEVMAPSFRRNFDMGGRPPWQPLSEATISISEDLGGGAGNVLVRSGKLRTTMSQKSIWTITDESASIRDLPESVWYGKIHQGGFAGVLPRGGTVNIPARPFVMFQDEDLDAVFEVFQAWLGREAAKVGWS